MDIQLINIQHTKKDIENGNIVHKYCAQELNTIELYQVCDSFIDGIKREDCKSVLVFTSLILYCYVLEKNKIGYKRNQI